MKKLIAVFIMALGFSLTATAQQKVTVKSAQTSSNAPKTKATAAAASKDVDALNNVVTLTEVEKKNFLGLFEYKHRALSKNPDAESKKTLSQTIEAKIRASLTPQQIAKLDSNKKVLQSLTN